jgi:NAD(P)-dependent dehydrogenase (short-subunit alcohol dehydrogenase family)
VSAVAHTLITGATSGVGNAVVSLLAERRPLLLHGRDAAKLQKLLESCSKAHPHQIWVQDLQSIEIVSASLEAALNSQAIAIDNFVHCAGAVVVLPARGAPVAATQDTFSINCISAQQIIASLLKKRVNSAVLRSVVFISSIYSRVGVRGHSIYCATKAALDGLMRALAVELAPDTRVNSILPGALDTVMAAQAMSDAQVAANVHASYPLGIGRPLDIANAVQFLLSDEARWLTGQELVIDGGRSVNFSLK